MTYNTKNKQIKTWQHSNSVWPKTDHFHDLDAKTDRRILEFIRLVANGPGRVRKWRKTFNILFKEYPGLIMSSYEHELEGRPWKEYYAIYRKHKGLAGNKCSGIVTQPRRLTGIV